MSHVTFNCPYCKEPLEVPEDKVSRAVECPACHGSIALHADDSQPSFSPAPKPMKQCPYCGEQVLAVAKKCKHCGEMLDEKLRRQRVAQARAASEEPVPENVEYQSHPAMFRSHPLGFLLCLVLCLVGIGFVIFLVWWISNVSTTLTVTNRKTTLRKGILSKYTNEVYHRDVRNIQISQSLLQRIFGAGTIALSSAGQAGVEILAQDMPDPYKVKEIVDTYRTE